MTQRLSVLARVFPARARIALSGSRLRLPFSLARTGASHSSSSSLSFVAQVQEALALGRLGLATWKGVGLVSEYAC